MRKLASRAFGFIKSFKIGIGVRGRLFLSFAAIVGLAFATSGFAVVSFTQLGGTVNAITTERLPPITAALQLARTTERIVALGPALAGADDTEALKARAAQLAEQSAQVEALLARMESMNVDQAEFGSVKTAIAELSASFKSLEQNVAERLGIRERSAALMDAVIKAEAETEKFLALLMNVAKSDFDGSISSLENADPKAYKSLVAKIMETQTAFESLKSVQDELRGVISTIVEATFTADTRQIDLLSMRVSLPIHTIKEKVSTLDERQAKFLLDQVKALEAAMAKESGVFDMRLRELSLAKEANETVEKARILSEQLSASVDGLVAAQQAAVEGAAAASQTLVEGRTTLLSVIALLIVVSAVLIVWLYVGRQVTGRLKTLEAAMRRIAGGELETQIPAATEDEIGAMAGALVVFRDNAIQIREANERAAREQAEASERRRLERIKLAEEFEAEMRGVVEAVSSSSTQLQSNAHTMAATADEASRQTAAVAAVSEQTTANVGTVATAAEELSSSIAEIARQVAESTRIAGQAVSEAERTNSTVKSLAEAAQKIGDVVKLISEIAAQTNLLALNATIEAARAGEAGKGFAVVASEVKNLATQTAKATEEITAQINAIQSTTGSSVEAIAAIGATINRVNEIANSIAAAVEEQGSATQEIARNVQEAARGTGEVSSNITGVAKAASQTGAAASQVLGAAQDLAKQAETLRSSVDQFLARIRVG